MVHMVASNERSNLKVVQRTLELFENNMVPLQMSCCAKIDGKKIQAYLEENKIGSNHMRWRTCRSYKK